MLQELMCLETLHERIQLGAGEHSASFVGIRPGVRPESPGHERSPSL